MNKYILPLFVFASVVLLSSCQITTTSYTPATTSYRINVGYPAYWHSGYYPRYRYGYRNYRFRYYGPRYYYAPNVYGRTWYYW